MNILSQKEKDDGWQLLFDGTTMQGWHGYNSGDIAEGWYVDDFTLHFNGINGESISPVCRDIVTDRIFSDFHLKIEWKISLKGNSGIMFYVQEHVQYRTPWMTGPEMQILDNDGHKDGDIFRRRAGDLYDLIACSKETVMPPGTWNQAEIICNKGNLFFLLNGTEVITITMWTDEWNRLVAASKFKGMADFAKFKTGRIALQDHGDPVWFRNIKIKEL